MFVYVTIISHHDNIVKILFVVSVTFFIDFLALRTYTIIREVIVLDERIKQLRLHLGLTQQQFADRIGVKRNTVAQYEGGRNIPIDSVVSLICKEYGVSEKWLRTGEGAMLPPTSRDDEIGKFMAEVLRGEPDSFRRRFVSALARLDANAWAEIEKFAAMLADEEKKE